MLSGRQIQIVTDPSAPGLLKYGLHRDLSSDTEDSDYKPGKKMPAKKKSWKKAKSRMSSESSAESTPNDMQEVPPKNKSKFRKKLEEKQAKQVKQQEAKVKRPERSKRRQFGELKQSDDSSDSDYAPNEAVKKLNSKRGKRIKRKKIIVTEPSKNISIKHSTLPSNDTWSVLPTEILSKILFYITAKECKGLQCLCRCSRVCQHWNYVISQPIVWKYVDLAFIGGCKGANDNLLKQLTEEKCHETKELNLSGWGNLTDSGLENVAKYCTRLEYLNLSNCQRKCLSRITGSSLVGLAEKCPLKKITFSNLRIGAGFSKGIVTFIQLRGDSLTHINLSGNIALGSQVVTIISSVCSQLISLDVSNTSVRSLSIEQLQTTCLKLQELYLANLPLELKSCTAYPGFSKLRICSVAKRSAINWLTNDILFDLLNTSEDLTVLDTRGNNEITHLGLQLLPCKSIERLYISHCRVCLQMSSLICEKWSDTLWDLDISWTDPYGASFDIIIDTLFNGPEPCKNITQLNLSGTSVSDNSVKLILVTCAGLESLDLTSCRGVSRGIKRLHESSEDIQDLREFYLI